MLNNRCEPNASHRMDQTLQLICMPSLAERFIRDEPLFKGNRIAILLYPAYSDLERAGSASARNLEEATTTDSSV